MSVPPEQLPPDWIYDGDPDAAFDDILSEMDQIDRLDDDLQRLSRNAVLLKCATVLVLALALLLGMAAPMFTPWAVVGSIGVFWVIEAFILRRRRLETQLQQDILKGASPAANVEIKTLQERYPARRMRWIACFSAREVFGFYGPFLMVGLLLSAFQQDL